MVSASHIAKSYRDMSKDDLEALFKVCVKDLIDCKVAQRAGGPATIRRQIARLLTRLYAM